MINVTIVRQDATVVSLHGKDWPDAVRQVANLEPRFYRLTDGDRVFMFDTEMKGGVMEEHRLGAVRRDAAQEVR